MAQGPPTPTFIFRGHSSPIHALHFFSNSTLLASGDSDGWIVIWSIATKRPVAVWKGHDGGIMGIKDWQNHKLISHGRDHKLRVWQLRPEDYEGLSSKLPVDGADAEQSKQPWLLHSLSINALNYCAFSICAKPGDSEHQGDTGSILLATSNGLDAGGIDIFQLPSEHRVCKLPSDKDTQTGMVMAVSLFHHPKTGALTLASGYETGHVLLHIDKDVSGSKLDWVKAMTNQPHSQPVLSLEATPNGEYVYSSSADAVIARFNVVSEKLDKKTETKHAGQQDLKVRDDGKIFATAGWDKRVRVYSSKTLKELAVLKWHQEGCYATAFATTAAPLSQFSSDVADNNMIKHAVDLLRNEQAAKLEGKHWLAAGGKDGKISLWEIY